MVAGGVRNLVRRSFWEVFRGHLGYPIMHTYHAETIIEKDGGLILKDVPFPMGEHVEVVVFPSREALADDEAWRRISIESFFRDTNEKDADYDNY